MTRTTLPARRGLAWLAAAAPPWGHDDHSRVIFVHSRDERKTSAVAFYRAAVARYAAPGGRVEQVTPNGALLPPPGAPDER